MSVLFFLRKGNLWIFILCKKKINKERTYFNNKNGKLTMRNTKSVQPELTEDEKKNKKEKWQRQ